MVSQNSKIVIALMFKFLCQRCRPPLSSLVLLALSLWVTASLNVVSRLSFT